MTEHILFQCGLAEVIEDDGAYHDQGNMNFVVDYYQHGVGLLQFNPDSDIGLIDGEPLDILLQCLEHRLATRNLAEPMFERTQACEHLRRLRAWLAEIADIEAGIKVSKADQSEY